jgi:hypothetical protein
MQQLSNFGHKVEGGLLLIVAIIAGLQAAGFIRMKQLWPSVIVVAGLFLIGFLLLHHGLQKLPLVWKLIMADPQQRQHLTMAGLLVLAGTCELLFRAYNIGWLKFVWPFVLCLIGLMFLIHEQHGSSDAVDWAQRIHRSLGILLILVSLSIVTNIFVGERYRWLPFVWPVLLIITSIFLFAYKEPHGAYEKDPANHTSNH